MNYLLKSRSKLIIISGIWTIIYGLMLRPSPEEVEGIQAILVVMVVWPGFFIFQVLLYGLFKKYQNQKVYVTLILLKSALFLIQPPIIVYQWPDMIFWLSILGVFLIDFHVMTLENKVDLNEVHVSDDEKKGIFEQYKTSWFLIGSVVLLFSLYFQFREGNYKTIILFSLFYLFFILRKQEPKIKFVCIQLIGFLAVYVLTTLDAPELVRGVLLIAILILIYCVKKYILNQQKTSNIGNLDYKTH